MSDLYRLAGLSRDPGGVDSPGLRETAVVTQMAVPGKDISQQCQQSPAPVGLVSAL